MPAYRDRDTLVLRAPDRRPVAEAAKLIDRELDRRPAPTLADVRLAPEDRALAMFQANYPALAERAGLPVLWARAHGHHTPVGQQPRRPCGWDMARAYARRHRLPIPRLDPLGLAVLGPPCPGCRAVVDPQPKPKAKAKPMPVRSEARLRSTARTRTTSTRPAPGALVASARSGVTAAQAAYNRAALRRMGIDPTRHTHLTRART
jgi:hypothetical protein